MAELTLFGIPNCDTCRKARKWLAEHGVEHHFHDLRDDGLDEGMLRRWSAALGWQQLINTRSTTWRRIPEADRRDLTERRAMTLMAAHPTLVKRPVFECSETIAVGFSPERYASLIRNS